MSDFATNAPTAEEYEWARRVVLSEVEDPDFMGVAEMLGDEWADLDEDAFDKRHRLVHDLACKATVTVSWPDEPAQEAGQDGDSGMSSFKPGDIVDISITGVRVVDHTGPWVKVAYPCFGGRDFPGEWQTTIDLDSAHVNVARTEAAG